MPRVSLILILLVLFVAAGHAESVAVITTNDTEITSKFASSFGQRIGKKLKLVDSEIAASAFRSFAFSTATNLSTSQAKAAAQAIGCDLLVVIDAGSTRRVSSQRPEYYEAYAAVFAISARTGRLIKFALPIAEEDSSAKAEKTLMSLASQTADETLAAWKVAALAERSETAVPAIEELPETATQTRDFQPPLPYRRIRPEYTTSAFLHAVSATVEITVDVEDDGKISRTEITRWAGFGLDEAVETAVRSMNWRPAYRKGKPLRMRVLLRYNFRKVDPTPR